MSDPVSFLPRRRYFVKRGFQGRLVLGVMASAFLTFGLMLADYYFSFGKNAGWSLDAMEIFFRAQKLPLIQLAVFVVVLVAVTVVLSHRVAGPLINLEKSLLRAAAGDLTHRIRLRPKDHLKEIRDAYNRMAESLQARAMADRTRSDEAWKAVETLAREPGVSPTQQAALRKIAALLREIGRDYTL